MLPPELMRSVISFAVGDPRQHRAILQASQVSQSFRQTVLDMSWLFTNANWGRWPTPLLDLWRQRARTQPLTVSLSPMTIHRLTAGEAPELALLESCSRRWGSLVLEIPLGDERCIRFVEQLLQCACPLLHTINGTLNGQALSTESTMALYLQPDCLPSLQTLHCTAFGPFSRHPPRQ